jgi:hypothetical protein
MSCDHSSPFYTVRSGVVVCLDPYRSLDFRKHQDKAKVEGVVPSH